jgi:transcriptional regulator with XRE-family HTH domain
MLSAPNELATAIGLRCRNYRKALRWSLDELAAKSGLSKTHIWQVEGGKSMPGVDTVLALAQALGVRVECLIVGLDGQAAANGESRLKSKRGPSVVSALLASLAASHRRYRETLDLVRPATPEIFRSIRKRFGLTQKEMAARLDITNVYLSWIETGKQEPSIEVYLKLCELAGGG